MTTPSQHASPFIDPVKLDKLAETAIKIGLQLQPGQDLVLTSPVSALPLARLIVEHAYKAGAGLVTPIFTDDHITLSRYLHGRDAGFDRAAGWLYEGMAKAFSNNAARLAIRGDDPALLSGQDVTAAARADLAYFSAYKPAQDKIQNFDMNWTIVVYPDLAWAKQIFPGEDDDVAVAKLASAIFSISRVDVGDPLANWTAHNAQLHSRTEWLNGQRFRDLHFGGPGTDLTVGLADGHLWIGGATTARNGVTCNPNIPSEEVFTTPHAYRVHGHASSTKPLSCRGAVIDEIFMRFDGGRVVEASARRGNDVLQNLLDSDEGTRRIGEVALVPHSSPVSQSGLLFFNTLYDENAASHIALGQCYSQCFVEGASLSRDQIQAQGGNMSVNHIDWMIGSGGMDVDGIDDAGQRAPVMRNGEWAY
jgi:aminopeptidase